MLQLPEAKLTARRPQSRPKPAEAMDGRPVEDASNRRLSDLECPISGAKTMSSVLSVLASKLAQEVVAYRDVPNSITASRMSHEINGAVDRVLYVAYEVEQMLCKLEKQYLAPLEDETGER